MKPVAESSSPSKGISTKKAADGISKLADPDMPDGLVNSSDDEEGVVIKHAVMFEDSDGDDD